jgi:hypothetical protein
LREREREADYLPFSSLREGEREREREIGRVREREANYLPFSSLRVRERDTIERE